MLESELDTAEALTALDDEALNGKKLEVLDAKELAGEAQRSRGGVINRTFHHTQHLSLQDN